MRTLEKMEKMMKTFLSGAIVLSLGACEEEQPKKLQVVEKPIEVQQKVAVVPPVLKIVVPSPTPTPTPTGKEEKVNLIELTRIALNQGKKEEGLKLGNEIVKKFPKRSAAWNLYGRAQLQNGQRKPAIESFVRAVKLNPNSSYALNNLGLALIYDGQFERAVTALESATEQTPVESYMWNNLGMAYEHVDRLSEARQAYREAVELKSETAEDNLTRLQGVKSFRTAKNETVSSDVTTVDRDDEHEGLDGGFLDGGE